MRNRDTPEYRAWCHVITRANGTNDPHKYADRGIGVCDRWRKFENFLADMGPRPSSAHSLDRIDNNRGYSPDNCRWATASQQQRNKRSNHVLTLDGKKATITDWAESYGIEQSTIRQRLNCGWSVHDAVKVPVGAKRRNAHLLTLGREIMSIAAWSRKTGINVRTISKRIKNGWSVHAALSEPVDESKRSR